MCASSRVWSPATAAIVPAAWVTLLGLRAAYALLAPPNSDEAYYWLWGRHPALSYFDHPPLHAWVQGLLHAGLGRSLLVLRLPTVLTTIGCLALVARLARRLAVDGRSRVGVAGATLLACPLLLMLSSFAWQDHLLVFLVLLSASLLLDFLAEVAAGRRGSTALLLGGAAALGAAGLAKYSAVFLAAGLVATIALDRRLRRLLRDRRLWLAGALCLAIVSPVLVWNARHGLASFRFHLVEQRHLASGLSLRPMGTVHFVLPTLLLLSPALAWAMISWARAPAGPSAWASVHRRLALAVFACSTGTFVAISLFSTSQYYWNVVAYLLLVPPAALVLSRRPLLLVAHLATGVVLATAMVVHATVLPLSVLVPGVEDEDSWEPLGWAEVASAARAQAREAGATAFLATDYRPGSHLGWALDDPAVAVLSPRRSQFDFWPGVADGATAIVVADGRFPISRDVAARFERLEQVGVVPVVRLGFRIKEYELWRGERFRGGGPLSAR